MGSHSSSSSRVITLDIGQVNVGNGGVYKCLASNYLGTDVRSQRVNVVGDPMVERMDQRRMVSGSTVWVHCPYKGYPIRKITWIKHGTNNSGGQQRRQLLAHRQVVILLRPPSATRPGKKPVSARGYINQPDDNGAPLPPLLEKGGLSQGISRAYA